MNSIRLSGPDFDADGAVVSATASIAGSADGGKDESIASGVHTVYGDAVWLLALMAQSGMTDVLRQAFPGRAFRARLTLHLLHAVLRDGSGITCDNFVAKSAASWLFPDIAPSGLREDVRFFKKMGEESVRSAFFGALL
ncbi:MAG: hypothetical protein Q4F72_11845, partial [Desulfovibrionaceae bacterium]|nr:hypothetical protein [Desulfovibrionaceae bacterium]